MPIDILMPAIAADAAAGRIVRWLVAEGAAVAPGCAIAELEAADAVVELTSDDEGTLARILVPAGSPDIRAFAPIAVLLGRGETPERRVATKPRASPLARRLAREAGLPLADLEAGSGPKGRVVARDVATVLAARIDDAAGGARATGAGGDRTGGRDAQSRPPLFSDEALAQSSAFGSIAGLQSAGAAPVSASMPSEDERVLAHYPRGSYDLVPHDRLRRLVATTARIAQATVPQFTLELDMRVDGLVAARERMNDALPGLDGHRITFTDLLIKAIGLALQQVPEANASWTELGMLRHRGCDVGVAIAVEGGLVMPVIRRADIKSLSEISAELRSLRDRAERRRLTLEECRGGGAGVSNLGMMGVGRYTALVNPPQASMLAVGMAERRPCVVGERLGLATVMSCALTCDQRVLDGAVAAAYLQALRALIEEPVRMLV